MGQLAPAVLGYILVVRNVDTVRYAVRLDSTHASGCAYVLGNGSHAGGSLCFDIGCLVLGHSLAVLTQPGDVMGGVAS